VELESLELESLELESLELESEVVELDRSVEASEVSSSSPLPSVLIPLSVVESDSSPDPSTVVPVESDSSKGVGLSLCISSSASGVVSVLCLSSKSIISALFSTSGKLSVISSIPSSSQSSSSSSMGLSVLVKGNISSSVQASGLHFSDRGSTFDSSQLTDLVPLDRHRTSRTLSPPPHGLLHSPQGPVNHSPGHSFSSPSHSCSDSGFVSLSHFESSLAGLTVMPLNSPQRTMRDLTPLPQGAEHLLHSEENHCAWHLGDLHGRDRVGTSGSQNSSGYTLPSLLPQIAVRVSVF